MLGRHVGSRVGMRDVDGDVQAQEVMKMAEKVTMESRACNPIPVKTSPQGNFAGTFRLALTLRS